MSSFRTLLAGLSMLLPVLSFTQVLDYMDVKITVLEKVGNNTKTLPNAKLIITDQGEILTDAEGKHEFSYAIRENVDPKISVALISDKYKTLKPLDASVDLDPSNESMHVQVLVVNMENESEAFKKRIVDLEKNVSQLRRKNTLTQQQLNALSSQLIDTIMYFESIKRNLENEISSYENLTDEQRQEIESLKNQNSELEEQLSIVTDELSAALEERYLRQKEYFDGLSSNLIAYLRKAKDIKDHLPYISTYFSSPDAFNQYGDDLKAYNEIFKELDDKRPSYLEGIDRYWENEKVSKKSEEVIDFVIKSIHQNLILPVANNIRGEFMKQRPKKAQKLADEARETMDVNLRILEKDINRLLIQLRNNI